MIFWYRNSVLASLVSIIGCVIVITGIAGLRDREIGVGPGILVIVAGIGIAALGKVISDRKAQKKTEQARTAQPGGKAGSTARYTENTGYAERSTSQNAGNTKKTKNPDKELEEIIRQAEGYAEKEEYHKELETLLSGLSIDSGNAVLLNRIGRAYRHVGDYNAALDYYFRSAKVDPNDLSIGTNIAVAYYYLGEYEKADQYFQGEITRLESMNNHESRSMLGITYANYALCIGKMGDLNRAREFLSKAERAGYKKCDVIWNMLMRT